ncbi:redoxin family protein [Gillisia hiemivivida]|uniref:Redoxin domain-containing protein n=1 Tax=Gillisia hiemivivida TaxID=291190 RepID=A0A5C6ZQ98_9FLAO|nr:redoxin family protein [Gillisia hiemivivida]TXD91743.1 redoxin domain-containing protein [Gillisia hiemivivida]
MRFFLLLLLTICLTSCQKESQVDPKIILSGKVEPGEAGFLRLETSARFKYHNQPELKLDLQVQKDGSFRDTIEIKEGHYILQTGNNEVNLYLKPGDDLQLKLNNGNISYDGEGAKENTYIKERDSLIAVVGGNNFYQYFSKLPEEEFLQYANSLEEQRLEVINRHGEMDLHLQKTERLWANVEKAHKFYNYSFTRETVETSYVASKEYPDPLAELDLNDEDLLHVGLFPMLIYSHFGNIASDNGMEEWEYIVKDSFPITNSEIREVAFYTTAVFSMKSFEKLDEFYQKSQEFIQDKKLKEVITKQYLALKELSPGKPAPNFTLRNMKDEPVSLIDFKGNFVYLDFWASWCKPCIEEIPAFKKLQKKYKNDKIFFVSIGIESNKESIQRLIEKHELNGIHLFDPSKEKELKDAYSVSGIPHYVLIDKLGSIIESFAMKPSDPQLYNQIDNLLE